MVQHHKMSESPSVGTTWLAGVESELLSVRHASTRELRRALRYRLALLKLEERVLNSEKNQPHAITL